ncbi:uncharacterized protein BJ212DRAFT_1047995 [Suillus subaureus]|uniref:Uncharacterized protein n=1 Tax=Suillus subaureus TaxID=48587 RepID=A0A9P7JFC4_9AGAM|nr:uncharacterized protein BJ212DRAFT_1047995 [Suillus subaureus]KAG1819488.1 hypothetical protein BJ212DRAFT_1047995 [Suillus subaureus]
MMKFTRGEFWASYGTPRDYESIETLEIWGRYKFDTRGPKHMQKQVVCPITSEALDELIEGRWDPPPTFPDQTLPSFPSSRAKKVTACHAVEISGSARSTHIPRKTPETPTHIKSQAVLS